MSNGEPRMNCLLRVSYNGPGASVVNSEVRKYLEEELDFKLIKNVTSTFESSTADMSSIEEAIERIASLTDNGRKLDSLWMCIMNRDDPE